MSTICIVPVMTPVKEIILVNDELKIKNKKSGIPTVIVVAMCFGIL